VNHYDRYMATLRGESVDFLPRLPILMQFAAEYIGSNYGAFASDYRVLVEANLRCVEDFDFEQVSAISDPYRETQGFGAEIVYVTDGVPRCPRPPLAEAKDLSALAEPDPLSSERMLDRVNALTAFEEEVGGRYSIMGWIEGPAAEAADLRGVTNFLMDLMTDEPFTVELMDRCVEVGVAFAQAQLEAGADTIGIGDAIASQISPGVYEKLIQPREQRLVDAIHEAGGLVRLHICGNITHLLPGIARLGVDILDFDHMVDARAVREAAGPDTVIAGNIDPAGAVKGGEPQAIRKYMQGVYAAVGNPFMVTAGCEIPPGTPNENLEALCEPIPFQQA
jgi:MtaA/CmuA family methyltransferase